jgi:hypothetical protein
VILEWFGSYCTAVTDGEGAHDSWSNDACTATAALSLTCAMDTSMAVDAVPGRRSKEWIFTLATGDHGARRIRFRQQTPMLLDTHWICRRLGCRHLFYSRASHIPPGIRYHKQIHLDFGPAFEGCPLIETGRDPLNISMAKCAELAHGLR